MKKNKYNYPRYATNSNNTQYNQYVAQRYFEDYSGYQPPPPDTEQTPHWKKNGRLDIYHDPYDNTDYHDDPYTVAQKFIDRTQMRHG